MSDAPPTRELGSAALRKVLRNWLAHSPEGTALDGLAAVGAALVLRHADEQESEAEAMSIFAGIHSQPSIPEGARWRDLCRLDPSARRVAFDTLPKRLGACQDRGAGALVRRVVPVLSVVPPVVLDRAFEVVRELTLSSIFDRHAVLEAIDEVLTSFAPETFAQYGTPPILARWIVDPVTADPDARVFDPCFGLGSFLVEIVRRRALAALDATGPRRLSEGPTIFGVEMSPMAFAIGLARVILAGEDQPALELGDVLTRPLPQATPSDGFDVVLAHPPLGARIGGTVGPGAALHSSSVELAFLKLAMDSLRPGGTACLVLPQSVLMRGGAAAQLRRELITRMAIRSIVQMPSGLIPSVAVTHVHLCFSRTEPAESIPFVVPQLATTRGAAAQRELAEGDFAREETQLAREAILASNDTLLVPQTQDRLIQSLTKVRSLYPLHTLSEIVEVSRGPARTADAHAGYVVTAAMIHDGRIVLPTVGSQKLPGKRPVGRKFPLLRADDILLYGSSGGIRAALVENGAVGLLAHRSLIVLRVREAFEHAVSPRFLLKFLQSDVVSAALRDALERRVARMLDLNDVAHVPVPVPPLLVQDRILRKQDGAPIFEALHELADQPTDPFEAWLDRSSVVRALEGNNEGDELATLLSRLQSLSLEVIDLHSELPPTDGEAPPWFLALLFAAVHLHALGTRTPSAETIIRLLLAQHELASARLHRSFAEYARTELVRSIFVRSDDLIRAVRSLIPVCVQRCSALHAVTVEPRKAWREHSGSARMDVVITNLGSVAVEELRLDAPGGPLLLDRLGPGESVEHTCDAVGDGDGARLDVSMTASFVQLDGERVERRFTVAADLNVSSTPDRPLDASPYVTGASITRSEMVYGRDPIFDDLARLLASPSASPLVLLEGNKRVGKTSIMNQLLASRAPEGYVVSYATLQGAEGRSEGAGLTDREIWLHVAHSVADALVAVGLVVPPPEVTLDDKPSAFARKLALRRALSSFITADHPYDAFVTWIELVLEALGERRLLVMIDEFDKLQEGVEAGVTSPQLVENLRAMYLQRPRLGFVIAGGRRLARLRTEYFSALFGVGHRITVGPLPEDAARALVTEPVRGQLLWLPDARDEVVRRCARHPFLIQAVCNQVFLRAARESERRIGIAFVEKALDEAVDGMDHFPTLWKQVGTPRRQLLLALCAMDAQSGAARDIGVLEEQLTSRGVSVPAEGIDVDLAALDELELIRLETEGGYQRYRLRLPIFAAWVQRRVDLVALAREASLQADLEEA